jgi:hypothetical protein
MLGRTAGPPGAVPRPWPRGHTCRDSVSCGALHPPSHKEPELSTTTRTRRPVAVLIFMAPCGAIATSTCSAADVGGGAGSSVDQRKDGSG